MSQKTEGEGEDPVTGEAKLRMIAGLQKKASKMEIQRRLQEARDQERAYAACQRDPGF